ncbi:DNA-binding response regulator [Alkalilimnicola ehrlichii]|uniref:response regulator transcription factor n=1 Tax=Alkalilimnicola ehrlichii TaxID=351052 RepID=UPI000E2FB77B|nr:response regulator transcription factor [Alkalilimnicola ehrlichii]RFA29310.1 DNA-binding response regulator [Alkalilimnicola ehrlichii]
MQVLIVEDNRDLAANIVDYLDARGHVADTAGDGVTGLHLAVTQDFDAIVLDLGLPGLDGSEVCRRLRDAGIATPVIMLTARGEIEDRIGGLELGADDYLVKPVSLRELEARLRAQVRRAQGGLEQTRLQVADLILDERTRSVTRAGQPIQLARLDYQLLRLLLRESPAVVSRTRLETEIWGDTPPETDSLRSHIHRLRRVLDRPFKQPLLHTVHGVGYRLAALDELSE